MITMTLWHLFSWFCLEIIGYCFGHSELSLGRTLGQILQTKTTTSDSENKTMKTNVTKSLFSKPADGVNKNLTCCNPCCFAYYLVQLFLIFCTSFLFVSQELKKRDIKEVVRVCDPTYDSKLLEQEGLQVLVSNIHLLLL